MTSHWGPLHWFTGCWHGATEIFVEPGHKVRRDQEFENKIWKCCECGRTKPRIGLYL